MESTYGAAAAVRQNGRGRKASVRFAIINVVPGARNLRPIKGHPTVEGDGGGDCSCIGVGPCVQRISIVRYLHTGLPRGGGDNQVGCYE